MRIVELEQNTPEWEKFRLGKLTGSRLASIWSAREYTVDDVKKLLTARGVDFKAYKKERDEIRGFAKGLVKADYELLLTEDDKELLASDAEKKLEYYQVLADRYAITPQDDEIQYRDAMERGHELEDEACQAAAVRLNKKVMVVGCVEADADPRIINSPDRYIKPGGKKRIVKEAMEAKCLNAAKHLMAFFERKVPEDYWTQNVQYFVTNEKLETLYWVFYNPRLPILPLFILVVNREDLGHWPATMLKYQLRTLRELDVLETQLLNVGDNIVLPARPEKGLPVAA